MTVPRVAVIGGGLAGLAAAARLRTLGARPSVLERDDEVGGVVRTEVRNGWVLDAGPCLATEPDAAVRALLDTAGMAEWTVRAAPNAAGRFIVHGGKPVPLPRTVSEFTSSSLLSLPGRLRLLKERFVAARRDNAEESVDSFARRRFGDEVAERMFDPLVAGSCAGDSGQILARYAFPSVVGHEQRSGSGLQGNLRARMEARRANGRPAGNWSCGPGMQQLARQLARWIGGVRTAAGVSTVRAGVGAIDVTVQGGVPEPFDAVVFAVPAPAFAQIGIDLPEGARLADVASMPHASVVTVSLGFQRGHVAHSLDGSRLLVPTREGRSILSVVFPCSAFSDRAPRDHVLLTAFVGGARRPELIDCPDADLIALVHQELVELLGVSAPPVITSIARWRDALPQAIAGHSRRLEAADAVEAAVSSVAFTGSWRDGLSVAEVLLGGVRAAERLATRQGWMNGPTAS